MPHVALVAAFVNLWWWRWWWWGCLVHHNNFTFVILVKPHRKILISQIQFCNFNSCFVSWDSVLKSDISFFASDMSTSCCSGRSDRAPLLPVVLEHVIGHWVLSAGDAWRTMRLAPTTISKSAYDSMQGMFLFVPASIQLFLNIASKTDKLACPSYIISALFIYYNYY